MRILIVTGTLAEDTVRGQTRGLPHDVDVISLPVSVASFITPNYAAKALKEMDLDGYDMILLPGTVNGNVSQVEEAIRVPTYKGPIHSADLPLVLTSNIKLSKTVPASDLIKEAVEKKALEEIERAERDWRRILEEHGGLIIGPVKRSLPVSDGLPMRVIAEIVNAPLLDLDEVKRRALYYESEGADIIDIGMLARNPKPETIIPIIKILRETVNMPLSIDSLEPEEIKTAVDAGIDLVLSVDAGNLDTVASYINDEAVVLLPTDMSKGFLPHWAEDRVKALEAIVERAKSLGIKKIIGDLVVEPLLKPGLMEALKAYQLYKARNTETQLLFGIGNAMELIDADSIGVNAVLSALAREAGSNILHVPEYSVKTKGSVRETLTASRMMFLAERRGTLPKDLGVDLLVLKEKRWTEEPYRAAIEKDAHIIKGIIETEFNFDKAGWFKVQLDRNENKIMALHYPLGKKNPETIIKGDTAREVYHTIIRLKLITKRDHAAYLGKELEKAAIALKLGRSYGQDEELF